MGRAARKVMCVCAGLVSLIVGCESWGGPRTPDDDALRAGVSLSLTGQFSREGRSTRDGYRFCERTVNGRGGVWVGGRSRRLVIDIRDDGSLPERAARIIDEFNDRGYKLILGPYGSTSTASVAAVVERNRQVMVNALGADDQLFARGYRRTFAVISPASEYSASILVALTGLVRPRPASVMFLSADDGFARSVTRSGQAIARRLGWRVFPTQYFPSGATDVSAALIRVRQFRPDLVFGSVHFVEGVAMMRQSRELGVRGPAFALTVAPLTSGFPRALNRLGEGVIGSSQWTGSAIGRDGWFGTAADFATAYRRLFGEDPQYHAAAAAAACLTMVLAVRSAGSTDPDAARAALVRMDEQSFFGRIKFDETGKNVYKGMTVVQIRAGRALPIWPPDVARGLLDWRAGR